MNKTAGFKQLIFTVLIAGLVMLTCACSGGSSSDGDGGVGGGSGESGESGGCEDQPAGTRPETVIFTDTGSKQLIAVSDDGSQQETVLSTPVTQVNQFSLSPNGKSVAYIADEEVAGRYDLYVRSVVCNTHERVSMLIDDTVSVLSFAWSPDSSKLAYRSKSATNGPIELFIAGTTAGQAYMTSKSGDISTTAFVVEKFGWSPDSRYVAYLTGDTKRTLNNGITLSTHDASQAGPNTRQLKSILAVAGKVITSFKWSPNSALIAFMSDFATKDNQFVIYTIKPDGATDSELKANGNPGDVAQVYQYEWSYDSRYLAEGILEYPLQKFIGINVFDVAKMAETGDTKAASVRALNTVKFGNPVWAHGSNILAFEADYTGAVALVTYDPADGKLTQVSLPLANNETGLTDQLTWSPDDSRLVYLTSINENKIRYKLYMARLGDTIEVSPFDVPSGHIINRQSWSGDSSKLGLLTYDFYTTNSPGNWYILDAKAAELWKSELYYNFNTSKTLRWSSDSSIAVYPVGTAGEPYKEILYSVDPVSGMPSMLTNTVANSKSVYQYPVASILK